MPGLAGIISDHPEHRLFDDFIKVLLHFDYKKETFEKNGIHVGRVDHGYINKGKQPILIDDQRYVIFFHGEIFSFRHVEAESIPDSGFFFAEIFQSNGFKILPEINGQFIAAVLDTDNNAFSLISDKMGTLPLYYTLQKGRLLFSSEVKSLILDSFERKLDWRGVSEMFHFGHLLGDKTLFEGVFLLPPASVLSFQDHSVHIDHYWDLPYDEKVYRKDIKYFAKEKKNYIESVEEVMAKAMKRSLSNQQNDLLFSLSGGLDSRYVVAFAKKFGVQPLKTFTIGPPESEDQRYAKEVAKKLGAVHEAYGVDPFEFWKSASKFSYFADGLSMIYGPVAIMRPFMDHYKKEKITITSQMCDALFGSTLSRRKIKELVYQPSFRKNDIPVFENLFNLVSEGVLKTILKKNFYERILGSYRETPVKYISKYKSPGHAYFMMLMHEHVRRGTLGGNALIHLFFDIRMPSYDSNVLDLGFRLPLPIREYQYAYRMAFSGLFPELKNIRREKTNLPIDATNSRIKAKEYAENIFTAFMKKIGHDVFHQPSPRKIGYVDIEGWFRHELKNEMKDFILGEKLSSDILYQKEGLEKIVSQHLRGDQNHAKILWQIINLEYFFRNFLF